MQNKYGFLLMDADEVEQWLETQNISRQIDLIQQHHTYLPDYNHFTGNNHFERLRSMKSYHTIHNGWNDIAQHFTTFPDGMVGVCRPLNSIPIGIKGANARGICIEHFGNFDTGHDVMTPAHRDIIIRLTALLCRRFSIPADINHIVYHHWYDLNSGIRRDGKGVTKSCPGTAFFGGNKVADAEQGFIPLIQTALAGLKPGDPLLPQPHVSPENLETGIVTASNLNVRSGPGNSFGIISKLGAGAVITVYESKNGWLRIDTQQHWVAARYVIMVKPALTTASTLNIRTGPGGDSAKIGTLPRGSRVLVYDTAGGWCKIDLNEKWVSKDFLEFD
ncbi:MAG: SH3 domain-containing protein [Lentimicrobiaceae bacterium]|nr:SH3 domain-containing protein [Lentimicrobiaceae bacterium]